MIKEILKIANYINELEEENEKLKQEIRDLQLDCEEWKDLYDELKGKINNKE